MWNATWRWRPATCSLPEHRPAWGGSRRVTVSKDTCWASCSSTCRWRRPLAGGRIPLRPMTKIVQVGNIACGADTLFLISGPCVIETESIMLRTAEKLKEVSERMKVPVIYKSSFTKDNRSSVDFYQGPGLEEGLKVLQRIKKDFGFPLLTDIHYPSQAKAIAEVCDV